MGYFSSFLVWLSGVDEICWRLVENIVFNTAK